MTESNMNNTDNRSAQDHHVSRLFQSLHMDTIDAVIDADRAQGEGRLGTLIRFIPRIIWWTAWGYRNARKLRAILVQLEPMAREAFEDMEGRRVAQLGAVSIAREFVQVAQMIHRQDYKLPGRESITTALELERRLETVLANMPPLLETPSSSGVRKRIEATILDLSLVKD